MRAYEGGRIAVLAVGLLMLAGPARGDDWLSYRGPHYDGVSREKDWQAEWADGGPRVAWRANVGVGASSMTVSGDRVLTMGNRNNQDIVWCLDPKDGTPIWQFPYPCRFEARQFEGGTASTPTIDGEFVYSFSYDGQLHCLRLQDGKAVWRKHVVQDFGGQPPRWKYAGSPLIEDNSLILDIGGNGSSTIALDKRNGKKLWGSGSDAAGYATPVPFSNGSRRAVMVFKAKAIVALDLASGQELWRVPWETAYDVNACTPFMLEGPGGAKDGRFFVSSGYGGGRGALFQLAGGKPQRLWQNDELKTRMSTCAVWEGYVYGVSEHGGRVMCVDLASGRTVWAQGGVGNFGTLLIADGKLLILSEQGELIVAEATPKGFKPLSRAKVLGGRCWVMPVLANGRIYCRNNMGELVCLDVRSPAP